MRKSASQSQHTFAKVPGVTQPRSTFNRTRTTKTTFNAGFLYPILCDELLPGDTLQCNMSNFVRLNTPIFPLLDNMYLESQFFAVPLRLLQTNFVKMMGEQDNPGDSIDFETPKMTTPGGVGQYETLSAYIGIPPRCVNLVHNSYWHRAYNKIWNEWYRDQNLQDAVVVDIDDGPDDPADYVLLKRGKRKDYYTSALPFAQKGTAISLPLGEAAPVVPTTAGIPTFNIAGSGSNPQSIFGAASGSIVSTGTAPGIAGIMSFDTITGLEANLSAATGSTVNQLRESFALQALLERDARAGSRYVESLQAHWGVTSPDFRLQRSEYLGGGSQRVGITPVSVTTANTNAEVGDLAGFGTSTGTGHGFIYSATEHCVVMCLVSVRADLTYQTGLARQFSRNDRYDFYTPDLAHLGEQEIKNKEVWANSDANDELVFGYQERWAEYRYGESLISGRLRSHDFGTLDPWHLSQKFDSLPVLGATFIEETPPMDRVVAVPSEPDFRGDFYFAMKHSRVMPTYSVPGFNNRF